MPHPKPLPRHLRVLGLREHPNRKCSSEKPLQNSNFCNALLSVGSVRLSWLRKSAAKVQIFAISSAGAERSLADQDSGSIGEWCRPRGFGTMLREAVGRRGDYRNTI